MHIINYCRPVCMKSSHHLKMKTFPIWVLFISLFLFIDHSTSSVDEGVRDTLIAFLNTLANTTSSGQTGSLLGWSSSLDPCTDGWNHVACNRRNNSVTKLFLNGLNLNGTLDAASLCRDESLAKSLATLHLDDNNIMGGIPPEIADCNQLARFHVSGNKMSGTLPGSLSMLSNLKSLDISNNQFSGELPNLARITCLNLFLAQYNQLSGEIPQFDFSNLVRFNVSYNNFSGCIPDTDGQATASSFLGNPELYGDPLPTKCPIKKSKGPSRDQILMYSGYAVLGLVLLILIIFILCNKKKKKKKEVKIEAEKVPTASAIEDSTNRPSEMKTEEISRSEHSGGSAEQSMVSSSLVVLTSPTVNRLKFEELLRAPAELLGRGKRGTLYKVSCENGMILAVKRIKDWAISSTDFKERMQRIDEVKHPNLLPALAFYCSKQEKLLVYGYQQNGSLYSLLHGTQAFEWGSRLCAAARIACALAFTHEELHEDGIAHGNLKSSNILLNKHMEPCISEYGLMVEYVEGTEQQSGFRGDICGLGVILLELLTGKMVQKSGMELANWVHSVVREEWTAEVFDKSLILEGASEERMVNVLQVALKCVNISAEARPGIKQVAAMINTIKEEEERSSVVSEA